MGYHVQEMDVGSLQRVLGGSAGAKSNALVGVTHHHHLLPIFIAHHLLEQQQTRRAAHHDDVVNVILRQACNLQRLPRHLDHPPHQTVNTLLKLPALDNHVLFLVVVVLLLLVDLSLHVLVVNVVHSNGHAPETRVRELALRFFHATLQALSLASPADGVGAVGNELLPVVQFLELPFHEGDERVGHIIAAQATIAVLAKHFERRLIDPHDTGVGSAPAKVNHHDRGVLLTHHAVFQCSRYGLANNLDIPLVAHLRHFGGLSSFIDLDLVEECRDGDDETVHLGVELFPRIVGDGLDNVGAHHRRRQGAILEGGNEEGRLAINAPPHFATAVVHVLLHLWTVEIVADDALREAHHILVDPIVVQGCSANRLDRPIAVVGDNRGEEVTAFTVNRLVFSSVPNHANRVGCSKIDCQNMHLAKRKNGYQFNATNTLVRFTACVTVLHSEDTRSS